MKTLKYNSLNEEVKTLKKLLNAKLGSSLDVENNWYGPTTEKRVKEFQKANGLAAHGIVGPLTWSVLLSEPVLSVGTESFFLTKAVEIFSTQVGVKEATGKNDGVEVEAYLKSTGLGKGYAWCQAFMYWGFEKAAASLAVANPMPKTAGVLDNWNKSKKYQQKMPQVGDVFVMDFGGGAGHTGIVTKVDGAYIETIEGNTSADPTLPSEDREGQGVFRRRRKVSSVNKGFIRYVV